MLNKIILHGRLTRDPELRNTQSGTPVASFTVAVDRDYASQGEERQTDFIDCVAWRQGGEFVAKYFRKGQLILVEGRLTSRKWEDRDGNKRTSWEVITDHTWFGEPKRDGSSDGYQGAQSSGATPPPAGNGFRDLGPGYGSGNPFQGQHTQQSLHDLPEDDGDLPF